MDLALWQSGPPASPGRDGAVMDLALWQSGPPASPRRDGAVMDLALWQSEPPASQLVHTLPRGGMVL